MRCYIIGVSPLALVNARFRALSPSSRPNAPDTALSEAKMSARQSRAPPTSWRGRFSALSDQAFDHLGRGS